MSILQTKTTSQANSLQFLAQKYLAALALTVLMTAGLSTVAQAQTAANISIPEHPYISRDDQRLQNQENRMDAGVKDGQINAAQELRDSGRDAKVSLEMTRDEAGDKGHLTNAEQAKITKQLNRNSADIYRQRHVCHR